MIRRCYHCITLLSKWEVSLAELIEECVWLCDVMVVLCVHHHRNILLRVQHSLFFDPLLLSLHLIQRWSINTGQTTQGKHKHSPTAVGQELSVKHQICLLDLPCSLWMVDWLICHSCFIRTNSSDCYIIKNKKIGLSYTNYSLTAGDSYSRHVRF